MWKFFDKYGQERATNTSGFGSGNDQQLPVWDAATASWKAKGGMALLWDSVDAGASLPAATITTPTLSQAFKHLRVVVQAKTDAASALQFAMRFNGDTSAVYHSATGGWSNGAFLNNGGSINQTFFANLFFITGTTGYTPGYSTYASFDIPAYRDTTLMKGLSGTAFAAMTAAVANLYPQFFGGQWSSTAAISTITFMLNAAGNYVAGTRISVYGIG